MKKILAVDDSSIIRRVIQGLVDTIGLEFLEAPNGQEALELLEAHYSDVVLILLDCNMPIKDGLETLDDLKVDERFRHIPVIMVTSEGEKTTIVRAIQSGASHYVIKPFAQQDLLMRIMDCVDLEQLV
jgi:two-component system, chemotaxis family, chemotaxis protein CheY